MPYSLEQDAFILEAYFRSGTIAEDGTWTYSTRSCFDQFANAFPEDAVNYQYDTLPHHQRDIVKRFRQSGSVCKGKSKGRTQVLTDNTVDDIQTRMEQSPNKSLQKLSEQTGLSYGSCRTTLKRKLHMHPYKVSVIQQLYPEDYRKRIEYCNWFNDNLNDDNILDRTFFTDEAWFHLSGYINSQNYRTWSTDNPLSYVETSLHLIKVVVWIAMSPRGLIGPIFFYNTINAACYREQLLEPFINKLHDDELTEGYFQQDGAAPHSARTTLQFFPNRLVSKGRWPLRSPDLTPLDFYLFGNLEYLEIVCMT